MAIAQDDSFAVHITRPSLERLTPNELEETGRGVVFVSAPQPPRVGTRVLIDIAVENSRSLRQQGMVIWSRPSRPGQHAGFRAQLENAHPAVLNSLRAVVDPLREERSARPVPVRPVPVPDAPVRERVRPPGELRRPSQTASVGPPSFPEVEIHLDLHVEAATEPAVESPPVRPRSDLRTRNLFKPFRYLALPPPPRLLPPPVSHEERTVRVPQARDE